MCALVKIEIGAKNEGIDPVYPLPYLPSLSKPLSYRKLSKLPNYVQQTGTILWKHHILDNRARANKTEKTRTTTIAWTEKFILIRTTKTIARDRECFNGNHFRATETTKKLRRSKISHKAPYFQHCAPKMAAPTKLFPNKELFMKSVQKFDCLYNIFSCDYTKQIRSRR